METRGILGSLRGNKRWRSNKEENDHGGKKKERKAAKMIVMGKKKGKGEVNGGTERKLTKADEGRSLDFAGNLNVHQQNCVLSVEREREPVLFNQIAFQSRHKPALPQIS